MKESLYGGLNMFVIQRNEDKRYLHLNNRDRIMINWLVEMKMPETFTTRTEAKDFIRRELRQPVKDFSFRKT